MTSLTMVAEKEDLLVAHGGKNHDYNFYRYAGDYRRGRQRHPHQGGQAGKP